MQISPTNTIKARKILANQSLPLQLRLDVIDVILGTRPAARIMLRYGSEIDEFLPALVDNGLSIAVGMGSKWQPRAAGSEVIDWMGNPTQDKDVIGNEKFSVLYLARTQAYAETARNADETKSDVLFGGCLGYPRCCVERVDKLGRVPEHWESFSLYARNEKYSPYCWPGAMVLDSSLLIHYPCSPDCEESIEMAKDRWAYIKHLANTPTTQQVLRAHSQVYWLTDERVVVACTSGPTNFVAKAHPLFNIEE